LAMAWISRTIFNSGPLAICLWPLA